MRRFCVFAVCLAGLVLACGKSSEKKETAVPGATTDSTAVATSEISAALKAKGFRIVQDRSVPNQRASRKASAVVYRAADGKSGGVIYVTRPTESPVEHVGWHWYFSDAAPDSVVFTEINRDGLWDARVFLGDRTMDLIQGEAFSLLGSERDGTAAMNGASSAPAELWKCFDGDSATAWRSPRASAFIEIPVPLGIERAELVVQLADTDQPAKLEVRAGDRKLQTIELSEGIAKQKFSLDPAAREATSLRIDVTGGKGDAVAISELEIR